jgi:hypothetical protein
MNQLSWLIYWADAAPNVATALCIMAFLALIVSIVFVLLGFTGMFGDEAKFDNENQYRRDAYKYASELAPRFRKLWPVPLISFFVWSSTFLVPSKDTFYLIAASEIGEQAVETPEFVKIRAVINEWLDDTIEEDTEEIAETE